MKHKAKVKKLERRISNFQSDREIDRVNREAPGTYHKPGSLKK